MDYKINQIKGELEANDPMMLDIDGLFFTTLNDTYTVWDYTEYSEHNNLNVDFRALLRSTQRLIENLAKLYELDRGTLFFQDEKRHYYVRAELLFVLLMYADQNLCAYFNNLLADTMMHGIAISNAMIYQLANARLPIKALENIINMKKDDNPDTGK